MVTVTKVVLNDAAEVNRLINEAVKYQMPPLGILIAALCGAFFDTKKQADNLLHIMSLQRESFLPNQLQRTIGFFAGAYPVRIRLDNNNFNPGNYPKIITQIKETLFQIPKEGLDYFVLKYLLPELNKEVRPLKDSTHLLLHHLSLMTDNDNGVAPAKLPSSLGQTNSPANPSAYLLNLTTVLTKKQLQLTCYYSSLHYQAETIQALLSSFTNNLNQILS